MTPWKPCPCCSGPEPSHALWEVRDTSTGDTLRVKVPWASRAEHYGWGRQPHVRWAGQDGATRYGLEQARGERGITVLDTTGETHRLPHGRYTTHGGPGSRGLALPPTPNQQAVAELRKSGRSRIVLLRKARALKPGQRWITVHPNGPDEKGVPVLIQQEPDGTHRIIAGAGGKLTHLRLKGVKSEEEHREASAAGAKEKRELEKKRKAGQGDDDKSKEAKAKADVEAAKLLAERDFVQKIRDRVGGVAADLDEDRLAGLSTGAKSLVLTRHHKKQVAEAQKQVDQLAKKLVTDKTSGVIETEQIRRAVEEDPVIGQEAQELAGEELELRRQEDLERKADRRAAALRTTSGDARVGERAAATILPVIERAPDPKVDLDTYGGRDDDPSGAFLRNTLLPSEEITRRAAQAMQDAKILAAAAKGEAPTDAVGKKVVARAVERAGLDADATAEDVQAAAAKEAARQARRAEVQKARARKFEEMQADPEIGEEGAERALAYADLLGGIATSASTAKKLGLTASERVPLQEPEIAEIVDVLKERQVLRKKQQEFQAINKAAEAGDYDRSRRAFHLDVTPDVDKIALSVEEDVQRELTERMLGMMSRKRSSHLQALSAGHYDGLADVGLGIAGQRFVDRPTVDAIGVGNAAILMRHAMEAAGHETGPVLAAIQAHHVERVTREATAAMDAAEKYAPGLTAAVEGVDDIERAIGQLDVHEADLDDAQRTLGASLGKLEATATLGEAFRRKIPDHIVVRSQSGEWNGSLAWLHSIGLKPTDYALDYKNGEIQIPKRSWNKLVHTLPKEELDRRQLANAIKAGKHDEPGYLPPGIVRRASSTFTNPSPDAPRYHVPLDLSGGVNEGLDDHVGSRLADGEQPHEILHDLLAPVTVGAAPDREAYLARVRELFPLQDAEGKAVKYDAHREHFQGVAEAYMRRRHGDVAGAFHAQDINPDNPATHEALFRALANNPRAVAAFTPTGSLTPQHARALRDHFYERMGIDPKAKADEARFQREFGQLPPEPSKTGGTLGLFSAAAANPEHREWEAKRDAILARHPRAGLEQAIKAAEGDPLKIEAAKKAATEALTPWERYVDTHGSLELAQRALQDEIRGKFVADYAGHHGRLTGSGLKTGVAAVTNQERHVRAVASPDEADELRRKAAETYARLRDRQGGRFAAEGEGAVVQKFTRHLEQETIDRQNQGSLFTAHQVAEVPKAKAPGTGERWTLGERAEAQIASVLPSIGAQFKPDQKVGLFAGLNMDGDRVHQQRVIRMREANGGRLAAFLGTGSGKSLTSIGAFTAAHARGEAEHGLYLVPSAVQEQFGGEMLRYTEPGRYRWATGDGKSHAERVAMLQDKSLHMRVMTHQSFRETATRMMAEHRGVGEEQLKADLQRVSPKTRAEWMRAAFDANGIPGHFTYLDEGHMATSRGGEDPSGIDMISRAATHPVNSPGGMMVGTATPHKNDESEVYSMASLVDPERYADRHEFMQAFGSDLQHNPDAIRRELAHLTYSAKIDPEGVDRTDTDNPRIEGGGALFGAPPRKVGASGSLPLEPEHRELVDRVGTMYDRARKARDKGQVDVEALRELSPRPFEGKPAGEHEAIARRLQGSLGIIKESAMRRAVNGAPPEINTKLKALAAVVRHDLDHGEWTDRSGATQRGKPSVIFTDRLSEARMIHEHLASQGVRAALYHGGLSTQEREAIRNGFNPEAGGKPTNDVVVATSAAEAGINMQRAKVIHHYDVPQTDKSHAQRSGRAYRQGQQGNVDVHNWHTDADFEQAALRRLRRKAGLGAVFQTPISNLDETGIAMHYHAAIAARQQGREVA